MGKTLAEKVWDDHVVVKGEDGNPDLLYIDLHLVHEVTSPQAFDGLRQAGRPVRRLDLTIATEDHNTPTLAIDRPIADPTSRIQIETLRRNCEEFGVRLHSLGDKEQGIVHVVGPQLGLTMPGITVVCGDSHTCTHGAFGAMAFGIGTSEVEHVLATQTLPLKPFKTMAITVEGTLRPGVTAKDIILAVIAKIGTGGGQGYVLEYRGSAIRALSMEGRMTICNMSIEAGARAGMVAPDQTTYDYVAGPRPRARPAPTGTRPSPTGRPSPPTTTPSSTPRCSSTPTRSSPSSPGARTPARASRCQRVGAGPGRPTATRTTAPPPRAPWSTWTSTAGTPMKDIAGRRGLHGLLHELAASRTCGPSPRSSRAGPRPTGVRVMVVPGSARVRLEAEAEGLDKVFTDFGAEWRFAGCSMCLGMNPDQLAPGERCACTSNRNFEGRQGKGGRTHLVSPLVAAATAVRGTLSSPVGPGDDDDDRGERRPPRRHRGGRLMDKITTVTGIAAPLKRSNVDTDQIIPAVYLKRVTKTGFEDALFSGWRQDPDFVLNQERVPGRAGPRRRARLRHRVVPRARRLGAPRLRVHVVVSPRFARHLQGQRRQAGPGHARS